MPGLLLQVKICAAVKLYREEGPKGFFEPQKRGGPRLLKPKVVEEIARGAVEFVPVIGNIATGIYDSIHSQKLFKKAKAEINQNKYLNHALVFSQGQLMEKCPIDKFDAELKKLGRKATQADMIKIIHDNAI